MGNQRAAQKPQNVGKPGRSKGTPIGGGSSPARPPRRPDAVLEMPEPGGAEEKGGRGLGGGLDAGDVHISMLPSVSHGEARAPRGDGPGHWGGGGGGAGGVGLGDLSAHVGAQMDDDGEEEGGDGELPPYMTALE